MLTIFLRRRCSRGCSRLANTRVGSSGAKSSNKKRIKVSPSCLLCPGLYYYYYYYYFSRASFPRASIEKTLKNVFDKKKKIVFSFTFTPVLSSFPSHFTLFQPCFSALFSANLVSVCEKYLYRYLLLLDPSFFFFFFFFFCLFFFFFFFVSELFFFPLRFIGSEHGSRDDISAYGRSGPTTKRGTSPSATFGASDAKRAPPAIGRAGWWSSASEKLQQQRGGAKHTRVCERRA